MFSPLLAAFSGEPTLELVESGFQHLLAPLRGVGWISWIALGLLFPIPVEVVDQLCAGRSTSTDLLVIYILDRHVAGIADGAANLMSYLADGPGGLVKECPTPPRGCGHSQDSGLTSDEA